MYALWTKLTSIEDILLGNANEVVDYLRINYINPIQQIRCMFSERAKQLKNNSISKITNNSISFRILSEEDCSFDPMRNYLGFIFYSYNDKSEFKLNGEHYKRGDILFEDIENIPNSSKILKSGIKIQQVYDKLFKSLFNWYFKNTLDKHFVGLGIIYENNKWIFDAFIFNSESMQIPFSFDEQQLLEMYILTWTKKFTDQLSIYDNARKMLDDQVNYIKDLLETQRNDIENIWTTKEINLAIRTFEHEVQDDIDRLFQTKSIFNTFTNIREQIQTKNENKLELLAEIFEHHQLSLKTESSDSFCQRWKQLKLIQNWLHKNDFTSLINFLQSDTFTSIESLFSISIPSFLDQLGICPESDPFHPAMNYIGLFIYLYNNQDEFILNKHQYKRGQILIRQKENITNSSQTLRYKQTSFVPLFIHEYIYELYFNEKPNQSFYGIGFIYEQGKWKFDILTYSGIHGIHSIYDHYENNLMSLNINEEHCIDLILSTIYINNKWKEELGSMYTINELESMARNSFRKEIEIIEELFQMKKMNLNENYQINFKNFLEQYKPNPCLENDIIPKRPSLQEINDNSKDDQILINSKSKSKFHLSLENNSPNLIENINSQKSSISLEPKKSSSKSKPSAFPKSFFRKRSNSHDPSKTPHSLLKTSIAADHSKESLENHSNLQRRDSGPGKNKEPINLYQLWRELCVAEQKILHNFDLNEFIQYLTNKTYLNYNESIQFIPPSDKFEEYNLMAKIKIDSQLQFINELYQFKKIQFFQEQSNHDKKQIENLFKMFEHYYKTQIDLAKNHFH